MNREQRKGEVDEVDSGGVSRTFCVLNRLWDSVDGKDKNAALLSPVAGGALEIDGEVGLDDFFSGAAGSTAEDEVIFLG